MENPSSDYNNLRQIRRIQANGRVLKTTNNNPGRFTKYNLLQSYFECDFTSDTSRRIAMEFVRKIKTRRTFHRQDPAFVDSVRNYIIYAHEYNMMVYKVTHIYPYTDEFSELLLQYILLEGQILQRREYYSKKRENQVQNRILRLLLNIYRDFLETTMIPKKEILQKSAKHIIHIFVKIRTNYSKKFQLLENMTEILLRKIGQFEKVNALKGKGISTISDSSISGFFKNVVTSDYGTDEGSKSPIFIDEDKNDKENEVDVIPIQKESASKIKEERIGVPRNNINTHSEFVWTICLDDSDDDVLIYSEQVKSTRKIKNKANTVRSQDSLAVAGRINRKKIRKCNSILEEAESETEKIDITNVSSQTEIVPKIFLETSKFTNTSERNVDTFSQSDIYNNSNLNLEKYVRKKDTDILDELQQKDLSNSEQLNKKEYSTEVSKCTSECQIIIDSETEINEIDNGTSMDNKISVDTDLISSKDTNTDQEKIIKNDCLDEKSDQFLQQIISESCISPSTTDNSLPAITENFSLPESHNLLYSTSNNALNPASTSQTESQLEVIDNSVLSITEHSSFIETNFFLDLIEHTSTDNSSPIITENKSTLPSKTETCLHTSIEDQYANNCERNQDNETTENVSINKEKVMRVCDDSELQKNNVKVKLPNSYNEIENNVLPPETPEEEMIERIYKTKLVTSVSNNLDCTKKACLDVKEPHLENLTNIESTETNNIKTELQIPNICKDIVDDALPPEASEEWLQRTKEIMEHTDKTELDKTTVSNNLKCTKNTSFDMNEQQLESLTNIKSTETNNMEIELQIPNVCKDIVDDVLPPETPDEYSQHPKEMMVNIDKIELDNTSGSNNLEHTNNTCFDINTTQLESLTNIKLTETNNIETELYIPNKCKDTLDDLLPPETPDDYSRHPKEFMEHTDKTELDKTTVSNNLECTKNTCFVINEPQLENLTGLNSIETNNIETELHITNKCKDIVDDVLPPETPDDYSRHPKEFMEHTNKTELDKTTVSNNLDCTKNTCFDINKPQLENLTDIKLTETNNIETELHTPNKCKDTVDDLLPSETPDDYSQHPKEFMEHTDKTELDKTTVSNNLECTKNTCFDINEPQLENLTGLNSTEINNIETELHIPNKCKDTLDDLLPPETPDDYSRHPKEFMEHTNKTELDKTTVSNNLDCTKNTCFDINEPQLENLTDIKLTETNNIETELHTPNKCKDTADDLLPSETPDDYSRHPKEFMEHTDKTELDKTTVSNNLECTKNTCFDINEPQLENITGPNSTETNNMETELHITNKCKDIVDDVLPPETPDDYSQHPKEIMEQIDITKLGNDSVSNNLECAKNTCLDVDDSQLENVININSTKTNFLTLLGLETAEQQLKSDTVFPEETSNSSIQDTYSVGQHLSQNFEYSEIQKSEETVLSCINTEENQEFQESNTEQTNHLIGSDDITTTSSTTQAKNNLKADKNENITTDICFISLETDSNPDSQNSYEISSKGLQLLDPLETKFDLQALDKSLEVTENVECETPLQTIEIVAENSAEYNVEIDSSNNLEEHFKESNEKTLINNYLCLENRSEFGISEEEITSTEILEAEQMNNNNTALEFQGTEIMPDVTEEVEVTHTYLENNSEALSQDDTENAACNKTNSNCFYDSVRNSTTSDVTNKVQVTDDTIYLECREKVESRVDIPKLIVAFEEGLSLGQASDIGTHSESDRCGDIIQDSEIIQTEEIVEIDNQEVSQAVEIQVVEENINSDSCNITDNHEKYEKDVYDAVYKNYYMHIHDTGIVSDWNVHKKEVVTDTSIVKEVQTNKMLILALAAEIKKESEKNNETTNQTKTKCNITRRKQSKLNKTDDNQSKRVTRSVTKKNTLNTDNLETVLKPQDFKTAGPTKYVKIHQLADSQTVTESTDSDSNDSESPKLFIDDKKDDHINKGITIIDEDTLDENLHFLYEPRVINLEKNSGKPKTKAEIKFYSPYVSIERLKKNKNEPLSINFGLKNVINSEDTTKKEKIESTQPNKSEDEIKLNNPIKCEDITEKQKNKSKNLNKLGNGTTQETSKPKDHITQEKLELTYSNKDDDNDIREKLPNKTEDVALKEKLKTQRRSKFPSLSDDKVISAKANSSTIRRSSRCKSSSDMGNEISTETNKIETAAVSNQISTVENGFESSDVEVIDYPFKKSKRRIRSPKKVELKPDASKIDQRLDTSTTRNLKLKNKPQKNNKQPIDYDLPEIMDVNTIKSDPEEISSIPQRRLRSNSTDAGKISTINIDCEKVQRSSRSRNNSKSDTPKDTLEKIPVTAEVKNTSQASEKSDTLVIENGKKNAENESIPKINNKADGITLIDKTDTQKDECINNENSSRKLRTVRSSSSDMLNTKKKIQIKQKRFRSKSTDAPLKNEFSFKEHRISRSKSSDFHNKEEKSPKEDIKKQDTFSSTLVVHFEDTVKKQKTRRKSIKDVVGNNENIDVVKLKPILKIHDKDKEILDTKTNNKLVCHNKNLRKGQNSTNTAEEVTGIVENLSSTEIKTESQNLDSSKDEVVIKNKEEINKNQRRSRSKSSDTNKNLNTELKLQNKNTNQNIHDFSIQKDTNLKEEHSPKKRRSRSESSELVKSNHVAVTDNLSPTQTKKRKSRKNSDKLILDDSSNGSKKTKMKELPKEAVQRKSQRSCAIQPKNFDETSIDVYDFQTESEEEVNITEEFPPIKRRSRSKSKSSATEYLNKDEPSAKKPQRMRTRSSELVKNINEGIGASNKIDDIDISNKIEGIDTSNKNEDGEAIDQDVSTEHLVKEDVKHEKNVSKQQRCRSKSSELVIEKRINNVPRSRSKSTDVRKYLKENEDLIIDTEDFHVTRSQTLRRNNNVREDKHKNITATLKSPKRITEDGKYTSTQDGVDGAIQVEVTSEINDINNEKLKYSNSSSVSNASELEFKDGGDDDSLPMRMLSKKLHYKYKNIGRTILNEEHLDESAGEKVDTTVEYKTIEQKNVEDTELPSPTKELLFPITSKCDEKPTSSYDDEKYRTLPKLRNKRTTSSTTEAVNLSKDKNTVQVATEKPLENEVSNCKSNTDSTENNLSDKTYVDPEDMPLILRLKNLELNENLNDSELTENLNDLKLNENLMDSELNKNIHEDKAIDLRKTPENSIINSNKIDSGYVQGHKNIASTKTQIRILADVIISPQGEVYINKNIPSVHNKSSEMEISVHKQENDNSFMQSSCMYDDKEIDKLIDKYASPLKNDKKQLRTYTIKKRDFDSEEIDSEDIVLPHKTETEVTESVPCTAESEINDKSFIDDSPLEVICSTENIEISNKPSPGKSKKSKKKSNSKKQKKLSSSEQIEIAGITLGNKNDCRIEIINEDLIDNINNNEENLICEETVTSTSDSFDVDKINHFNKEAEDIHICSQQMVTDIGLNKTLIIQDSPVTEENSCKFLNEKLNNVDTSVIKSKENTDNTLNMDITEEIILTNIVDSTTQAIELEHEVSSKLDFPEENIRIENEHVKTETKKEIKTKNKMTTSDLIKSLRGQKRGVNKNKTYGKVKNDGKIKPKKEVTEKNMPPTEPLEKLSVENKDNLRVTKSATVTYEKNLDEPTIKTEETHKLNDNEPLEVSNESTLKCAEDIKEPALINKKILENTTLELKKEVVEFPLIGEILANSQIESNLNQFDKSHEVNNKNLEIETTNQSINEYKIDCLKCYEFILKEREECDILYLSPKNLKITKNNTVGVAEEKNDAQKQSDIAPINGLHSVSENKQNCLLILTSTGIDSQLKQSKDSIENSKKINAELNDATNVFNCQKIEEQKCLSNENSNDEILTQLDVHIKEITASQKCGNPEDILDGSKKTDKELTNLRIPKPKKSQTTSQQETKEIVDIITTPKPETSTSGNINSVKTDIKEIPINESHEDRIQTKSPSEQEKLIDPLYFYNNQPLLPEILKNEFVRKETPSSDVEESQNKSGIPAEDVPRILEEAVLSRSTNEQKSELDSFSLNNCDQVLLQTIDAITGEVPKYISSKIVRKRKACIEFDGPASKKTNLKKVFDSPNKKTSELVNNLPYEWDIPDASHEEEVISNNIPQSEQQICNPKLIYNEQAPETINTEGTPEFTDALTLVDSYIAELEPDMFTPEFAEFLKPFIMEKNLLRPHPMPSSNVIVGWMPQRQHGLDGRQSISVVSPRTISATITKNGRIENKSFSSEEIKKVARIAPKQEITFNFNNQDNRDPVFNSHGISANERSAIESYPCHNQIAISSDQLKAITDGSNDHNYSFNTVMSAEYGNDNIVLNANKEFEQALYCTDNKNEFLGPPSLLLDLDLYDEDDTSIRREQYTNPWDNEPKVIVVPNEEYTKTHSELKEYESANLTTVNEPWPQSESMQTTGNVSSNETWLTSKNLDETKTEIPTIDLYTTFLNDPNIETVTSRNPWLDEAKKTFVPDLESSFVTPPWTAIEEKIVKTSEVDVNTKNNTSYNALRSSADNSLDQLDSVSWSELGIEISPPTLKLLKTTSAINETTKSGGSKLLSNKIKNMSTPVINKAAKKTKRPTSADDYITSRVHTRTAPRKWIKSSKTNSNNNSPTDRTSGNNENKIIEKQEAGKKLPLEINPAVVPEQTKSPDRRCFRNKSPRSTSGTDIFKVDDKDIENVRSVPESSNYRNGSTKGKQRIRSLSKENDFFTKSTLSEEKNTSKYSANSESKKKYKEDNYSKRYNYKTSAVSEEELKISEDSCSKRQNHKTTAEEDPRMQEDRYMKKRNDKIFRTSSDEDSNSIPLRGSKTPNTPIGTSKSSLQKSPQSGSSSSSTPMIFSSSVFDRVKCGGRRSVARNYTETEEYDDEFEYEKPRRQVRPTVKKPYDNYSSHKSSSTVPSKFRNQENSDIEENHNLYNQSSEKLKSGSSGRDDQQFTTTLDNLKLKIKIDSPKPEYNKYASYSSSTSNHSIEKLLSKSGGSYKDLNYTGSNKDLTYSGSNKDLSYTASNRDSNYSGSNRDSNYSESNRDLNYSGSNKDVSYIGSSKDSSYSGSNKDLRRSLFKASLKRPTHSETNSNRKIPKKDYRILEDCFDKLRKQGNINPHLKLSENQAPSNNSRSQNYNKRKLPDYRKSDSRGSIRSSQKYSTSRSTSESNRIYPESSRNHQESSRTHQESSRIHQESNRMHQESSRTHLDSRSWNEYTKHPQHSYRDGREPNSRRPSSSASTRPQYSSRSSNYEHGPSNSESELYKDSSSNLSLSEDKKKVFDELKKCVQTQLNKSKMRSSDDEDWCRRVGPLLSEDTNPTLGLNRSD